ncbi:hypothetical protein EYF80_046449 [Liparis tanakae]|uniref:Uncharacterized protein n=1 Tax=Liparis tanakae TaxID=230148 RepID=A0A4Z2FQU0_9TELE|nr:hypothetical protein EYF80_046449 [Liparis tanakae]
MEKLDVLEELQWFGAVPELKGPGSILASWCYEVVVLALRVGAAQATQLVPVALVHLQEESVLRVDGHPEAKGRFQEDIVLLHVDLHGAVRAVGGVGEFDGAVVDLKEDDPR